MVRRARVNQDDGAKRDGAEEALYLDRILETAAEGAVSLLRDLPREHLGSLRLMFNQPVPSRARLDIWRLLLKHTTASAVDIAALLVNRLGSSPIERRNYAISGLGLGRTSYSIPVRRIFQRAIVRTLSTCREVIGYCDLQHERKTIISCSSCSSSPSPPTSPVGLLLALNRTEHLLGCSASNFAVCLVCVGSRYRIVLHLKGRCDKSTSC